MLTMEQMKDINETCELATAMFNAGASADSLMATTVRVAKDMIQCGEIESAVYLIEKFPNFEDEDKEKEVPDAVLEIVLQALIEDEG